MNTLDTIKTQGAAAIEKLIRGEKLTENETIVAGIYNRLNAGKSFNAGKRKQIKTGK